MDFYRDTIKEVYKRLKTSSTGLSKIDVASRQNKFGPNIIADEKKFSKIKLLLQQFNSPLIYILLAVVLISGILERGIDAIAIAVIIVLNALLGFWQEFKSEKALEALKKMAAPNSKVIRAGKEFIIPSSKLVPGDIILLEAGDLVPADARVFESSSLQTNESSLTGESTPIFKHTKEITKKCAVADQENMVFSGTIVTDGNGKAVVVSIGKNTEFGKIAESIKSIEEEQTHLQERLAEFSKKLGIGIVILTLILFGVGLLTNIPWVEALLLAATLAVAAIPEGLPAVVTISLALGIQRMVKRNALIRRLAAVETLGAITTICSDKTGTLTKGEMTVRKIYSNDKIIEVSGSGYDLDGKFSIKDTKFNPQKIEKLLETISVCNNAKIEGKNHFGDPTEIALIVAAHKADIHTKFKRVKEVPFNSERKFMATLDSSGHKKLMHVKGAPEIVLKMCKYIEVNGRRKPLTDREKHKILEMNNKFASSALRVLGAAYSHNGSKNDLTFLGLVGMVDPPREGVKDSISLCEQAGIRTVMITGDHALTAKAIGEELGIGKTVLTGEDIDKLHGKELTEKILHTNIFARVNPQHKLKILEVLQESGEVVSMTGDGINDAPALKKADVGVAMGITGTEVSKEAADMILLDDNFSTITGAIEHGRAIYDNIKKFVKYLLGANLAEVLIVATAVMAVFPLPLLPLHLLWLNLVTDGLPALALSVEKPEKNVMKRKPRDPNESIMHKSYSFIFMAGILGAIATLGIFFLSHPDTTIEKARTLALSTLVMFELFLVFVARSDKQSIFSLGFFSNRYLFFAVLISIILHLIIIYTPVSTIFGVTGLSLAEWGEVLLFSIVPVIPMEIKKLFNKN